MPGGAGRKKEVVRNNFPAFQGIRLIPACSGQAPLQQKIKSSKLISAILAEDIQKKEFVTASNQEGNGRQSRVCTRTRPATLRRAAPPA
jgi:hypothetical protein